VDVAEGEMLDERCVVVYKAKCLPKDVALKLGLYDRTAADAAADAADAAAAAARAAALKAASAAAARADASGGASAAAAETRKRDRRTVGEIMRATEDAKRAAYGGGREEGPDA
jgi:enoyl-CoA hydratase/carnithine racemase